MTTHLLKGVAPRGRKIHLYTVEPQTQDPTRWRHVAGGKALCGSWAEHYWDGTWGWWESEKRSSWCKKCWAAGQKSSLPRAGAEPALQNQSLAPALGAAQSQRLAGTEAIDG